MNHRIMIVEDHCLLRDGLRSMISAVEDFEVVAEARDGKEALQLAHTVNPDLIMMDLSLPFISGMEATTQIKQRSPLIKILALSVYKSQEYVRAALKAGVDGYVLKDSSYGELIFAIRSVLSGKKFLDPAVSGQVVNTYLHGGSTDSGAVLWDKLTVRERAIVKLVAEGHTNQEAARCLNISSKTIEKHRSSLMHKLNLRNATDLVLMALQSGWVDPEHMHNLAQPNQLKTVLGTVKTFESTGDAANPKRRSTDSALAQWMNANLDC